MFRRQANIPRKGNGLSFQASMERLTGTCEGIIAGRLPALGPQALAQAGLQVEDASRRYLRARSLQFSATVHFSLSAFVLVN
jgi:hypothetical protein